MLEDKADSRSARKGEVQVLSGRSAEALHLGNITIKALAAAPGGHEQYWAAPGVMLTVFGLGAFLGATLFFAHASERDRLVSICFTAMFATAILGWVISGQGAFVWTLILGWAAGFGVVFIGACLLVW